MKTIEERAIEYEKKKGHITLGNGNIIDCTADINYAYLAGATEQKAIMLEEASGEFDSHICSEWQKTLNGYDLQQVKEIWAIATLSKMKEIEELKMKLNTCKNDYWFMTNLIERYGSDKDQTLKDCLERMKFREPLFKTQSNKDYQENTK